MRTTLTGQEILNILEDIKDKFNSFHIKYVQLASDCTIYLGSTGIETYWEPDYQIGIYELVQCPEKEFPIDEAMIPIVCMFHEVCGHGGQLELEFQKDTPLSKVLALNWMAGRASESYYNANYWERPDEAAAQYMAIKEAYIYLSHLWGSRDATGAVLAYEKYRLEVENGAYLKEQKTYSDVESILADLNQQFLKNIHSRREEGFRMASTFSPYAEYIHKCPKLEQKVWKQTDGLKQDFLLASMYHQRRNQLENLTDRYPVICIMEHTLSHPFRPFQYPIRPKPRDEDLNLESLSRRDISWTEGDHQDFADQITKLDISNYIHME